MPLDLKELERKLLEVKSEDDFLVLMERLKQLSYRQECSIYETLVSCAEELGELGKTIRIEERDKRGTASEPSYIEAIDLILCTFEIYFRRGGTISEFTKLANLKLDKFEATNVNKSS